MIGETQQSFLVLGALVTLFVVALVYFLVGARTAALKAAERTASKAVQQFRDLFDATPDALLLCDRDGLIVLANAACDTVTEIRPGRARGTSS